MTDQISGNPKTKPPGSLVTLTSDELKAIFEELHDAKTKISELDDGRKIQFNFMHVHEWATKINVDYNLLCAIVRESIIADAPESNWQPIDTAPKDGSLILAIVQGSDVPKVLGWLTEPISKENKDGRGVGWRMSWDSYLFEDESAPISWMPLPQ